MKLPLKSVSGVYRLNQWFWHNLGCIFWDSWGGAKLARAWNKTDKSSNACLNPWYNISQNIQRIKEIWIDYPWTGVSGRCLKKIKFPDPFLGEKGQQSNPCSFFSKRILINVFSHTLNKFELSEISSKTNIDSIDQIWWGRRMIDILF